jgi:phosphatidylinositol-3-phosphatase
MSKPIGISLFAIMVAGSAHAQQIGDVFYIALENHNFVQPSTVPVGTPEQLLGNAAAPYLNSLVTAGNPNAAMTSYASNYQNVYPGLHPSEPNYVWQESGVAGPLNDADPFPSNIVNSPNLSGALQQNGISWKSYQEDTDLMNNTTGQNINGTHSSTVAPTNTPVPTSQYEVPLTSFSGTSLSYTNPYNGSHQYNFATKHDGQLFFTATNGGNDPTSSNPEAQHYAPLQQLSTDLTNSTVGKYNWITPDQYNDMHSSLTNGFTYNGVPYTGDQAAVAEGDNFLSIIVPLIEASSAFKNNGEIVIWNDETEGDEDVGSTAGFEGTEIVISPLAKGNAYTNNILYTHSNDLATVEGIFGLNAVGASSGAYTMADLYKPGVIANPIPEPSTWAMMGLGFAGLAGAAAIRRRAGAAAVA